jgi:hypothetical protein
MKTPSTFLYDLVSRFTKSEKLYIKVQYNSGKKDYIALSTQKTFDEDQLAADKGVNDYERMSAELKTVKDIESHFQTTIPTVAQLESKPEGL